MIEFRNVEIKYDDFVAIKNLNLTVNEGEFFTCLGPSGCGKTTTLRSLAGFIIANKGQIFVNGKDITRLPVEKRKVSIVFQSYALFPTMSVYDNIAFGLKIKKYSKEKIRGTVMDIAQKVDLKPEQLEKNISQLSGGQQQRVAIARALVMNPSILVMDEPLSNLDAKLRVQLRSELKRLQREFGITTIYVTHDQEEALTLSDRIAVFNNGFVEQIGTPYDIYNNSSSRFVCDFIGQINQLDEPVLQMINEQAAHNVDPSKEGFIRLERVFTSRQHKMGDLVKLVATVEESEYYGMFTTFTYRVGDIRIRNIERNDGLTQHQVGEEVNLFLDANDIMQF